MGLKEGLEFELPEEKEAGTEQPSGGLKFSELFEDPFAQTPPVPEAPPAPPVESMKPRGEGIAPSRGPGRGEVLELDPPAKAKPIDAAAEAKITQITVAKQFQSLRKQVNRFFQELAAQGRIVELDGIAAPLTEIVDHLQNHEDFYVYRVFVTPKEEYSADPNLYHALDVCILSVVLATSLGFTNTGQLMEVAMCGLLHDVGMAVACPDLWKKEGLLGDEDRKRLQEHPIAGFQLLKPVKGKFHFLDLVVLQEHEREDASGYPNRLSGSQIHPYAKIIGLCDVVESLTHPRIWREAHTPYDMVKILLAENRTLFDQKILKRFLQRITPFPPGTLIQLNTGEHGHVVHVNRDNPLRPIIQVEGKKRGEPAVDLKKSPLLYVVKAFRPGEKAPTAGTGTAPTQVAVSGTA